MAKKREEVCCSDRKICYCKSTMAILVIILVWVSQATWSKILITVAAAMILFGAGCGACKKENSKKR